MKTVYLDIETTAIDPERGVILEFGAIIEDTNRPLSFNDSKKFHRYIRHEHYKGDAFAISMHSKIWQTLAHEKKNEQDPFKEKTICGVEELAEEFYQFLYQNGFIMDDISKTIKITVGGKNVLPFDIAWCRKTVPHWDSFIRVNHRAIDPAILYWQPKTDETLPDLSTCKNRMNSKTNESVAHTAIEDAWDCIELVRNHFGYHNFELEPQNG